MKPLVRIFAILTTLLIIDLSLYLLFEISFAGHLADQILFWCWLVVGIIFLVKVVKNGFTLFFGFILIAVISFIYWPIAITIFSFFISMTPTLGADYLYQDKDIRVEVTSDGIMGMPYVQVTKKYMILEKKISRLDFQGEANEEYHSVFDIKSIYRTDINRPQTITLGFVFESDTIRKEILIK
jgi:hypothetical protein